MKIKPEIFREYDIRGVVDKDLTQDTVELLGKGIGTYFRRHKRKEVALGAPTKEHLQNEIANLTKNNLSKNANAKKLKVSRNTILKI